VEGVPCSHKQGGGIRQFGVCLGRDLKIRLLLLLYHPHFRDSVESWQVFPDDESICAFLQNEAWKGKEIITLEDNKFPKGLNPLESSFSSSDVENKKENEEEESKRKIGSTTSVNIET
jgi:hypothetical protein